MGSEMCCFFFARWVRDRTLFQKTPFQEKAHNVQLMRAVLVPPRHLPKTPTLHPIPHTYQ
jgi:hypothetical protein